MTVTQVLKWTNGIDIVATEITDTKEFLVGVGKKNDCNYVTLHSVCKCPSMDKDASCANTIHLDFVKMVELVGIDMVMDTILQIGGEIVYVQQKEKTSHQLRR